MRKATLLFISAALILSHPLFAQAEEDELRAGQYEISYEDGLVTARANEADVEALLKDFSNKSGISFNKYSGKIKKASLDLEDVEVDDFLNRLLDSYVTRAEKIDGKIFISSVTILEESAGASKASGGPRRKRGRERRGR